MNSLRLIGVCVFMVVVILISFPEEQEQEQDVVKDCKANKYVVCPTIK